MSSQFSALSSQSRAGLPRWADVLLAGLDWSLVRRFCSLPPWRSSLDSRGPAFYRQQRVGLDGEMFEMLKLRTMTHDAPPGGIWDPLTADDPRITRVGAFLRKTSLDELPNLFNVVRGEMAIVGPRPTISEQVAEYTPEQRRRLEVKPGLTGWAQVNGRASLPWEERIKLDVWYVDNRSARLDLRILGRTVALLATGHGLYEA